MESERMERLVAELVASEDVDERWRLAREISPTVYETLSRIRDSLVAGVGQCAFCSRPLSVKLPPDGNPHKGILLHPSEPGSRCEPWLVDTTLLAMSGMLARGGGN